MRTAIPDQVCLLLQQKWRSRFIKAEVGEGQHLFCSCNCSENAPMNVSAVVTQCWELLLMRRASAFIHIVRASEGGGWISENHESSPWKCGAEPQQTMYFSLGPIFLPIFFLVHIPCIYAFLLVETCRLEKMRRMEGRERQKVNKHYGNRKVWEPRTKLSDYVLTAQKLSSHNQTKTLCTNFHFQLWLFLVSITLKKKRGGGWGWGWGRKK